MVKIEVDLKQSGIEYEKLEARSGEIFDDVARLASGELDFTGWVSLPETYDKEEFSRVKAAAEKIKGNSELLIVIGIGGSYLGARAVIEAITEADRKRPGADGADGTDEPKGIEVLFAGNNISAEYHNKVLKALNEKETSLCVISKSGTTVEPSIAFAVLKEALIKKYGKEEAIKRIYAITDASKGVLRKEADEMGYETFIVPDDIGGRYSVLTPVGLLPIAAAGIDIDELMAGAMTMRKEIFGGDKAEAFEKYLVYAAARRYMKEKLGKTVEIFEFYQPRLAMFAEWLKQLFGESEGKDGEGIFPASLLFSADLHSMGQFLQQGNQIFFETVLDVCNETEDVVVPESVGGMLGGKSMNRVNRAALTGVIAAHRNTGVPIIKIDIPKIDAAGIGQTIFFFETCCAVSCMLAQVNPFDQPGVESYKAEMKKELQK